MNHPNQVEQIWAMHAQRREEQEKVAREQAEELVALKVELAQEVELEQLVAEERRREELRKELEEKEKEYVGQLDKRAGKRKTAEISEEEEEEAEPSGSKKVSNKNLK